MNLYKMINDDDNVSQVKNLKAINRQIYTVILRDLCHYLIRKPCYTGENRARTPRLRYFVYFLDFEMYSASRGPPRDSVASCLNKSELK